MNRKMVVCFAMAVIALSSQAVITNTLQFGGQGSDSGWDNNVVTNTGVSPTEYSVSYGVPEKYALSEISNLVFTVTYTETNDIPVRIRENWLSAGYTNEANDRLTSNEVLQVKVSYSDPDNKLMDLKATGFGTYWNTAEYEITVFSDGVSSFPMTNTANDFIQDYDTTGLTQLSTNNVGTWNLLVSVDDTHPLGGGTNFTDSALGAFVLEYIADGTFIPDPPDDPVYTNNLTPAVFDFYDGCEIDNVGIGTFMIRSNSWATAITLETIDVIGQDLTLASEGTDNKSNVNGNPGNAMGINSKNNGDYGNEPRDFNPNEGWVISFDVDVYLDEIVLSSTATDTVMTVSSSAFSDFVLLGLGSSGTFSLTDTYLPAGTNIMFQMTSTTNASDISLRINNLTVQSVLDENSYDAWIQDEGLTFTVNDAYGDDPDEDSMDNLAEYAFGGDPLVDDASVYLPGYELIEADDTLVYIYRRRMDHVAQGVNYMVGSSVDLVTDPITNATVEVGSLAIDGTYESVTNEVSTATEDEQFMQLKVLAD